jgi:hypothetical protein
MDEYTAAVISTLEDNADWQTLLKDDVHPALEPVPERDTNV